jgi:ABC-2 type transport system ATP-binding protein
MPAVEARDLVVRFGGFTAVDRVSFAVEPGEIFGFLGANGAGKTTTIRVLCGLLHPSAGQAWVDGVAVEGDLRRVKARVGYMTQRSTLYADLSVDENLAFQAGLRGMSAADLARRRAELFSLIGFAGTGHELVASLPGGLRQQVSLAQALLHDPRIVFLDEPTAGVAPEARSRFWALIRGLAGEGRTVFVTTHYMDEAEQCGRIALMRDGKLIALDSPLGLKGSTYPRGLVEVDPGAGDWRSAISAQCGLSQPRPHGLRWRLEEQRPGAWEAFAATQAGLPPWRHSSPTLEDVFLKLVEGKP